MDITVLRIRGEIKRLLGAFFSKKGYLEVETPTLSTAVIPESHIELFSTNLVMPSGKDSNLKLSGMPATARRGVELFLLPSPEIWMKRLLARGYGSIFQICKCYRNGESVGGQHNPEFTMLEWYTVNASYIDSMDTTEELFQFLGENLYNREDFKEFLYPYIPDAFSEPFKRMSVREAFSVHAGFDLLDTQTSEALSEKAASLDIATSADDNWESVFNKVFLTHIEPKLPAGKPIFLYDYPSQISTLSKKLEGGPFSERWELYFRGIELANCYTEERDEARVEQFFKSENEEKKHALVPVKTDFSFTELFNGDFPKCSGVALGVDRLVMAFTRARNIGGVILFPLSDTLQD